MKILLAGTKVLFVMGGNSQIVETTTEYTCIIPKYTPITGWDNARAMGNYDVYYSMVTVGHYPAIFMRSKDLE